MFNCCIPGFEEGINSTGFAVTQPFPPGSASTMISWSRFATTSLKCNRCVAVNQHLRQVGRRAPGFNLCFITVQLGVMKTSWWPFFSSRLAAAFSVLSLRRMILPAFHAGWAVQSLLYILDLAVPESLRVFFLVRLCLMAQWYLTLFSLLILA